MPPELAFKISIPIGDLAGRENWSTALSTARLSGHRNFTEQICMPNANLRQAKAVHKSNRLTVEAKNLFVSLLTFRHIPLDEVIADADR